MSKVTYVVCDGKSVQHGVAKKVGNETTVELQTFIAGDPVDIGDDSEIQRLLDIGVIRLAGEDVKPIDGLKISKGG